MQKITTLPEDLRDQILVSLNERIDQYTQTIVKKPWGQYTDIYRNTNRVLKLLEITPQDQLSVQSHQKRMEIWIIESGKGELFKGQTENELSTSDIRVGDIIVIQPNEVHSVKNVGLSNLIILELQYGLCLEDDIIRYSDIYGRVND